MIMNIADGRDACFFWAAHRLAALACPYDRSEVITCAEFLQRFPFGRAAFGVYFYYPFAAACWNAS
ncbi:MAG TPA: hypothetical protein VLN91_05685, partial [Nitrospirota bacterium]|nr:hypothetical protein [Nitrospirota bacterium]